MGTECVNRFNVEFALNQLGAYFAVTIRNNPDNKVYAELYERVKEIRQYVSDVQKSEWELCCNGLPNEEGHYLVYAPNYSGGSSGGKESHDGVMFSRFKNEKWSIEHGYHKRPNCVKAWMPLPKP